MWDRLHSVLLKKPRSGRGWIDRGGDRFLPRAGSAAGPKSGLNSVDHAHPGGKHHVLTDGQAVPFAVSMTGGNRNDVTQLLPLLNKVRPVAGVAGRPRSRPDALLAGRGYDHETYRRLLRRRGSHIQKLRHLEVAGQRGGVTSFRGARAGRGRQSVL